jgi:oligopeptide transport system substrate-binding protein
MAIDRGLLLSSVALDGESEAYALIPDGIRKYDAPRGYLLNVLGAQKTLRDLGYCGKKKTEGVCKSVPPLNLIYPDSEKKRKVALALAALLKKNLGIDEFVLTQKSPEEFVRDVKDGDYMIALDDLAVTPDRPFGFLDAFRSGRATAGGFSSKEFEQYLKDAERAPDWNDARAFLRRAESTLLRDGGIIPLFHATTPILVSPAVAGYKPNIWDLHPYSQISLSK